MALDRATTEQLLRAYDSIRAHANWNRLHMCALLCYLHRCSTGWEGGGPSGCSRPGPHGGDPPECTRDHKEIEIETVIASC